MLNVTIGACVLLAGLAFCDAASAAGGGGGGDGGFDSSATARPADPNYRTAVSAIEQQKYEAAVPLLQQVIAKDPKNADAYNYLGYTSRKLGDRQAALGYYSKALEIDPRHLGANEYLGELYLEMGDLPNAEARLSRLDDLCLLGCSQYTALKQAVKAYKARPKS